MHGCIGRVNDPQVDQLEETCKRTEKKKLDEADQTLPTVEVVEDLALLQSFLVWLNYWVLSSRTTGIHFLFILIEGPWLNMKREGLIKNYYLLFLNAAQSL